MKTIKAKINGEYQEISGKTFGEACNKAEILNATIIKDGQGGTIIRIFGEYVYLK